MRNITLPIPHLIPLEISAVNGSSSGIHRGAPKRSKIFSYKIPFLPVPPSFLFIQEVLQLFNRFNTNPSFSRATLQNPSFRSLSRFPKLSISPAVPHPPAVPGHLLQLRRKVLSHPIGRIARAQDDRPGILLLWADHQRRDSPVWSSWNSPVWPPDRLEHWPLAITEIPKMPRPS